MCRGVWGKRYLGSRAGSHSPRHTSLASFAQRILNCFVALACVWGWGQGPFQLWIYPTECVSKGYGAQSCAKRACWPLLVNLHAPGQAPCGHQTGGDQHLGITWPFSPLPVPLGLVKLPGPSAQVHLERTFASWLYCKYLGHQRQATHLRRGAWIWWPGITSEPLHIFTLKAIVIHEIKSVVRNLWSVPKHFRTFWVSF